MDSTDGQADHNRTGGMRKTRLRGGSVSEEDTDGEGVVLLVNVGMNQEPTIKYQGI